MRNTSPRLDCQALRGKRPRRAAPRRAAAEQASLTAAMRVYREKPQRWALLQQSCMRQDFSWNKAALQYEQLAHEGRLPEGAFFCRRQLDTETMTLCGSATRAWQFDAN